MRRLWDDMVTLMPDPPTRPAYDRLEVDATGAVWLEHYLGEAEVNQDRRWEVFSSELDWLGPVTLPPSFQVFEIGNDYILGVRTTVRGEEHVQMLALRRGPGDEG